jgi:hypothetical protein
MGRFRTLTPVAPATVSALPRPYRLPARGYPYMAVNHARIQHQKYASQNANEISGLSLIQISCRPCENYVP